MRPLPSLTALLSALLLPLAPALPASARTVPITVLHTTDIHGSLRRPPEHEAARYPNAGLDRLATLIRQAADENPNHLLLDGGDYAQGTLDSTLSGGHRVAEIFNTLSYDAIAVGNHEFDWGVPALASLLEVPTMPVLAANLRVDEAAPASLRAIRPWIVRDLDGVRVGVVGLTTPNLPRWFAGLAAQGIAVEDTRSALERVLPEIKRENPDVLILLAHQGLIAKDDDANEINLVGRLFPEFDLVLGGHLHWALPGAHVGKIDYAQSGACASGVMKIDLHYDTVARRVVSKSFDFLQPGPDTPPDGAVRALIEPDVERADALLSDVLATLRRPAGVTYTPPALSPVQQIFARAVLDASGAAAVFHGVFSTERLQAGPVTLRDLWRIAPYENTVAVLALNRQDILDLVEETLAYLGTERYVPLSGFSYDLYPNAEPGTRVRNLRLPDGSPLHGTKRYPVAVSSYMLAGGGGRFPTFARLAARPESRIRWLPGNIRDIVERWLRAQPSPLDVPSGAGVRVFRRERDLWERIEKFENSLD